MLKTLCKKQLMEYTASFRIDRKTGKKRSSGGLILFGLLYLYLFGVLAVMFFTVASQLCAPLAEAGLSWFYFVLMSLLGLFLGVFGSAFNTFAGLYKAKDNELLLSMPIPPRDILLSRMLGVWLLGFLFELLIMVPTVIVYFLDAPQTALSVTFSVLNVLLLSLLILVLSCALGWVIALVAGKLKNKSIITVLIALLFIGGYYYVYSRAYVLLEHILTNGAVYADKFKRYFYPIYLMGRAAEGDALSMLLYALIVAALFALVCFVMAKSFLKIATAKESVSKKVYRAEKNTSKSVSSALFGKEVRRYLSSATYILNCSLGTIFLLAAGIVLLVKGEFIGAFTGLMREYVGLTPLIAAAAIAMLTSMNDLTAPSVSLEGKQLWILQTYPVDPWKPLSAKLALHLILTLPPTFFCAVCAAIAMRMDWMSGLAVTVFALVTVVFEAAFGLMLNLKLPNLNWTNETFVVKQGASVGIALFGMWGVVLLLGVLYYLLRNWIVPILYLWIAAAVMAAVTVCLLVWLKQRGSRIFAGL